MEAKFTPKQFADMAAALLRMHLKYDTYADGVMGDPSASRKITPFFHQSGDLRLSARDIGTFTPEQCGDFLSPHMERMAAIIRHQHKDGLVLASLEMPGGLEWAESGESGRVCVRLLRGWDIATKAPYTCVDVLVLDFARFVAVTH